MVFRSIGRPELRMLLLLLVALSLVGCRDSEPDTAPPVRLSWTYSKEELDQVAASAAYLGYIQREKNTVAVMGLFLYAHGYCGGAGCKSLTLEGTTVAGTRGTQIENMMVSVQTDKDPGSPHPADEGKRFSVAALQKADEMARSGGPPVRLPLLKFSEVKEN